MLVRWSRKRTPPLPAALVALLLCAGAPAHAQTQAPVIAAAGDIACDPESELFNNGLGVGSTCRQRDTSEALVRDRLAAVLALGDNQYEDATYEKFLRSYDPTWGRVKAITRPAVGNHEYHDGSGASGYFDYFNGPGRFSGPAGERGRGYYSFDVGGWHVIVLNSMCSEVGGCGPGSSQERWLRADLEAHRSSCTLAAMHHPLYSSGGEGAYDSVRPFWQALYEHGADVVLAGHAHVYERFAPQDPHGNVDREHGMRQFVVGTGGKSLGAFGDPWPNSEVRDRNSPGVIKLTLRDGSYDWRFVRNSGVPVADSGSERCHGEPPVRPPTAVTGRASSVRDETARLNAAVETHKEGATYYFEYGRAPTYGLRTPERTLPAGESAGRQVSARISRLRAGGTYHYRVVARTASGFTVPGENRTFTTGTGRSRYERLVAKRGGLLSYWRLGDVGGDFGFDQQGRALAALERGYSVGQPGALVRDRNRAAAFDGVSGEMKAFRPEVARSATIEGWFLWQAGTALMRDDSFLGGWILAFDRDGALGYRVADRNYTTPIPVTAVRDGQWHHIALTKRAGKVAYYVDGDRIDVGRGAVDEPATMPWHVMRNGPHPEFSAGLADEVAIYRRALPRRAIEHHYDAGKGDRLRKTRYYPPARHRAVSGDVVRRKRSLPRLLEDDDVPLEVRAEGSFTGYAASTDVVTTIARTQRRTLRRLAVQFEGGASAPEAYVSLRIFNYRTRTWDSIAEELTGFFEDRGVNWSQSRSPRSYVSPRGQVKVKVVGRNIAPFRLRTDMIRFVVQY